jgi:hypothetical protein
MRASAKRATERDLPVCDNSRKNGLLVNKITHDRGGAARSPKRDWRRIHHSPLFWVGVAMFLTAILTYVFSEDLSLRPRLNGPEPSGRGNAISRPSKP